MRTLNEDWPRRERLVDELLELPDGERAGFIDDLARSSPEDASALRAWLDGIERSQGYLESSHASPLDYRSDQRVGNWRALHLLGRGGMGEVWLGERADGLFEKRVAIKFIRDDRPQLRRSVELESRTLAKLQHSGIVRLLDAGATVNGHPFLVTDLIEGTPLETWIEAHQPSLSQRLTVFCQILEAVAYAHEQLVIHRDIKPSNILIDKAGRPHLLDFGIAHALASETDGPQTTVLAFTPEFASPELIVSNAATVRSDIYALGALLYFLLCGKPPLRLRGLTLAAMIDAVRQAHPVAPTASSAIAPFPGESRRLLADLDAITLKALSKAPSDRYSNAEAFWRDIQAARASQPILARSPSTRDRALRFVQRHRVALGISTILGLVLLVGIAATLWQAHLAQLQKDRAEHEAARATSEAKNATAVRDFLVDVFQAVNPERALGKTPTALELIDAGVRRVDAELADQPALQAQLLDTLGVTYASLAQHKTAEDTLTRARTLAVAAEGETSALAMKITIDFARVVSHRSDEKTRYEEAAPILKQVIDSDAAQRNPEMQVAALTEYGALQADLGDFSGGEKTLQRAVALGRTIEATSPHQLSNALATLHYSLLRNGHLQDAIAAQREALDIELRLVNVHNPRVTAIQRDLALMLSQAGKLDEAADMMDHVVQTDRELYGEDNQEYAAALTSFGGIRDGQGHYADAERMLTAALAIARKPSGPSSTLTRDTLNVLSIVKFHMQDFEQATQYAREALAISISIYGPDNPAVLVQRLNLAVANGLNGDYAHTQMELEQLMETHKRLGSDDTLPTQFWLGYVKRMQGDAQGAEELHQAAIAKAQELQGKDSIFVLKTIMALAEDERDLGKLDQARTNADVARAGFLKLQHDPDSDLGRKARFLLAQLDVLQNRCGEPAMQDLHFAWEHRQQAMDTPPNRWQTAEAGLFLGLCRRQRQGMDNDETNTMIVNSARILRSSTLDTPFLRRRAISHAAADSSKSPP